MVSIIQHADHLCFCRPRAHRYVPIISKSGHTAGNNREIRPGSSLTVVSCLSAVLSAKAYPREVLQAFQKISEEYSAIHGYQIAVNLDEIMDTGLLKKNLLDIDYSRVKREMTAMALQFLDGFGKRVPPDRYTEEAYIRQLFHTLKEFYLTGKGKWDRYTAACGNGLTVLNLDLQGNLYPCHNTSRKAGTIRDGYFTYLQHILAGDPTHTHRKECLTCTALAFCQGGCKLVGTRPGRNPTAGSSGLSLPRS